MDVSIIIINYNGKFLLKDCIQSVLAQSYQDFEIILIDNASTDGSFEFMKETFDNPKIKIYGTESNLGFAGGNNFGLIFTQSKYIVLLNNDTKVEKDWLKYLVETLESNENFGIVQSLVYTEGISLEYYEMNGTLNLLGHNIMRVFEIDENGTGEILQATGCSLIIRKEIIDKTGSLFPDEYFLYAEDSFLSFKTKFAGYKLVHTSKSIVHHIGNSATKNQKQSEIYYYQERNRLLNFLIFFNVFFIIRYIPILIVNFKLKFIYSIFSERYSIKELFHAYFWIIGNIRWIKNQRYEIKKLKMISDNEVLRCISGKYFNGNNYFEKSINFFFLLYCRLTAIKVTENAK
jgi:GT2 family glycosyltransferase